MSTCISLLSLLILSTFFAPAPRPPVQDHWSGRLQTSESIVLDSGAARKGMITMAGQSFPTKQKGSLRRIPFNKVVIGCYPLKRLESRRYN